MHKISIHIFLIYFVSFYSSYYVVAQVHFQLRHEMMYVHHADVDLSICKQHDCFWYVDFFKQQHIFDDHGLTGRGIKVVVLDTIISNSADTGDPWLKIIPKRQARVKRRLKINSDDQFSYRRAVNQKNKNLTTQEATSKEDLKKLLKKQHGENMVEAMRLVASNIEIISIPVLDDDGCAQKIDLCKKLQDAYAQRPDMLYLGLQVHNCDEDFSLTNQIRKILKKFPVVIAAAGNNGVHTKLVGYPANLNYVLSVGSITHESQEYRISDFCQASSMSQVDVAAPGDLIAIPVWNEGMQDYIWLPQSGTSIAAAFMVGIVALVLEQGKRYQVSPKKTMRFFLESCDSYKIVNSSLIKYGVPNLAICLDHMNKKYKQK